jgi:hypothetical protein
MNTPHCPKKKERKRRKTGRRLPAALARLDAGRHQSRAVPAGDLAISALAFKELQFFAKAMFLTTTLSYFLHDKSTMLFERKCRRIEET